MSPGLGTVAHGAGRYRVSVLPYTFEPFYPENVQIQGSGTQPLLFAHGFGFDQNMWCFITPAFENDYRIILFEPHVLVPSLIMQSAGDSIALLEVGQYVHRHLPQSTLHLMQATGHCPHLSRPRETIDVMRNYLSGTGNP